MFKRTKGYFLLTMLVLTGLAGRLHTTILTTKERHTLVAELKTSKKDLLKSVEDLSAKQLNFKADKNTLSIKECIYRLISIESSLWASAQHALDQEPSSMQKTIANDKALIDIARQENSFQPKELKFKNSKEALKFYKSERTEMLRYVQTSTQNVRQHVTKTSFGNFDAYQLMLLNTIYAETYIQKIEEIKAHPNFPK
ncbi:MAG TPA: hypothetical protein VL095_08695 [Flavisolibacter sp.]|nr:hypothetical protein [Flavisolibacter sp.]